MGEGDPNGPHDTPGRNKGLDCGNVNEQISGGRENVLQEFEQWFNRESVHDLPRVFSRTQGPLHPVDPVHPHRTA